MRNHKEKPVIVKFDFWLDPNVGAIALIGLAALATIAYFFLSH